MDQVKDTKTFKPEPEQLQEPLIFDTHAHLQDPDFRDDLDQLLENIAEAGVGRVVLPASDLEDSRRAAKLALSRPGLYCVLGVHPHEAKSWTPDSRQELIDLVKETQAQGRAMGREKVVVGIGEIGLDYHYDFSPRHIQAAVYREQIEIAQELNLPVIIHEREAFLDSFTILEMSKSDGLLQLPFACHCFSGSPESAKRLLKLNCYLGFDGPITFKKARQPQASLSVVPDDRFLLETDSPYLTPVPFRGQRNDPSMLHYIALKAAEVRNRSYETILAQNWDNACRFFGLDADPQKDIL
ncbi:MAG: TatD family hydrolase [Eubacteriales bacterium]|nr:TatD family hydrolase [Eubacteriales bacterium]